LHLLRVTLEGRVWNGKTVMGSRSTRRIKVWYHLITAVAAVVICKPGAEAAEKVTITVLGTISPSCTLDGNETANTRVLTVANLEAALEYGYNVKCNTPFKYSIVSENGALALEGSANSQNARVPYEVNVRIPTDDIVIEDRCFSETIKVGQITCAFHDSRNSVAINSRAKLTVHWLPPHTSLPAGTYSDRLTFSVGVQQ